MILGRINNSFEATLPLEIVGPNGARVSVDVVLDTGFTDFLTLPQALITRLGLQHMDTAEYQLADGSVVNMESFFAVVQWHGAARDVLALAAGGDPLIGMAMVRTCRVTMDVVSNGAVKVEAL